MAAKMHAWQSKAVALTTVQHTSAPRAGRRFEPTHELALHEAALAACASLPGSNRGVWVVQEMTGPIGIPDLTALVADLSLLRSRLAIEVQPVLNQLDAAIVATTKPSAPRSHQALAKALGWPVETIMRRVPHLVRSGALIAVRPDRYVRPAALRPLGRLYAIEAKVSDRGAAIQQARAYGAWADSYVLIMGALGPRPLQLLLDEVEADGGGLVVDGKWLRRPVMRSLDPARRFWSAEHFVAAVKSCRYQPSVVP